MKSINGNKKNTIDYGGRHLTRYSFGMYDDNERYADVKAVLDEVDALGALLKDAVIKYVRSEGFNKEEYIQRRR